MPNRHVYSAMELKQIRYFAVVAQEGNISRAAARLHITQPALSRQIHTLEEQLGVTLIERAGRGIRLTHAGKSLLPRCRELLAQGEALQDLAGVLGEDTHYEIRIGSTPHFIEKLLATAIGRLRAKHPGVAVMLTEAAGEELRVLLEHNDIHIALPVRQIGPPFQVRALPPVPVQILAPPDHPFGSRTSVELNEVIQEPALLLRRGFLTREVFESVCELAQLAPSVRHESGSAHTLAALASEGFGVAVLPATAGIKTGVVPLTLDGHPVTIEVGIAWNPHADLLPATTDLMDDLERIMAEKMGSTAP